MNKLSVSYQHMVLKYLLEDDDFFVKCMSYLSSEYFSNGDSGKNHLVWFYQKIKQYHKKYNSTPSIDYLIEQIKNIKNEHQQEYIVILDRILQTDVTDRSFIRDHLKDFIKINEFKKLHIKTAELFNDGLFDHAFEETENKINKINKIEFAEDDFLKRSDIEKLLDTTEDIYEEEIDIIGQEFKLDEYSSWNGCIPKGSVTTIIGPWNSCKSTTLINCTINAAKKGNRCLFMFHEGRKEQILYKFLAAISDIPYNVIRTGIYKKDADYVQKIEEAKDLIEKYIRIKEMREVGINIDDVCKYSINMYKEWPFQLLINDYAAKISIKKSYGVLRHDLGKVWNSLDLLSGQLSIAILTAAQTNREGRKIGKEGEIIRSDQVSECAVIAHVSETIITLNRTPLQEENSELILCVDKLRDGRAGLLIHCTTDLARSIAHSPKKGLMALGYDGAVNLNGDDG